MYPESAPNNWREQLEKTGLRCAISPLHDKDIYDDGEQKGLPKKPHYHVILCYEGPQTYNAVKAITERLRQPIPQPLDSIRGAYRYLTHDDHPDKFQYSKAEITFLNGFDYRDYVELTKSEIEKIKREILDFIVEREITEYIDLNLACIADDAPPDWFGVVSSNTMYFDKTIQSLRFKLKGRRD